jgi:hypothetical protein
VRTAAGKEVTESTGLCKDLNFAGEEPQDWTPCLLGQPVGRQEENDGSSQASLKDSGNISGRRWWWLESRRGSEVRGKRQ